MLASRELTNEFIENEGGGRFPRFLPALGGRMRGIYSSNPLDQSSQYAAAASRLPIRPCDAPGQTGAEKL